MNTVLQNLHWRYATKRMNGEKVPVEKMENILESIRLTATSNGLQPFTVLVIEDEELRKKLLPAAFNQPQLVEGSHLLIFAAWKEISAEKIDRYFEQVVKERNLKPEDLAQYATFLKNNFSAQTQEQQFNWASKQAYIALGTAMVAAAEEKVDSTPMEGFNPAEVDAILGLTEKGLGAAALLALGYRDTSKDHMANAKKVRRAKEELFIKL